MSYPGSKAAAGVWQRIIGQMPPHPVYLEGCFGSGQVFWKKRRAAKSILVDKDAAVLVRAGAEAGVEAWCGYDIMEVLPRLNLPDDAVGYFDPPYPLQLRKGRSYYKFEMTTDDHAALIRVLLQVNFRVLLSGYPSELYSSQLQNWRCISYATMTRGRKVTECLWCNFPEPDELHDWRFAGFNHRQRTSLKRLASRWLAKLDAMAPRQRGYVLNAIGQRYFRRAAPAMVAHVADADPGVRIRNGVVDLPAPDLAGAAVRARSGAAVLHARSGVAGL